MRGMVNAAHQRLMRAWESSYLARLPHEVRQAMLADAFVVNVPAGNAVYEAYGPPRMALLHSGQARVKVVSPAGRSVTIRYAGPGQVIGLPSVLGNGAPVGADAIIDCEVSMFNVTTVRRAAIADARVSWLFAQQASQILFEVVDFLGGNLFDSVQQRVSRHLLDLASNSPAGLIVEVDQHEIADAIGSVREVVARALRRLREDGLIGRTPQGITLLEPSRLHAIAAGEEGIAPQGSVDDARTRSDAPEDGHCV
jgi:CRP/FNR family transcriptional regulator, cyclic AMP receptor protein